jgi:hypothetical protein
MAPVKKPTLPCELYLIICVPLLLQLPMASYLPIIRQGYVIRRILRRAVRYGYTFLSFREPFIFKLS